MLSSSSTFPRRQRRRHGEFSRHAVGPAAANLAGGDDDDADLVTRVDELEGVVVVGEGVAVRVGDGDELEEGEVESVVGDGELGELKAVMTKEDEEDGYGDEEEEEEQDCGEYA
ncbi:hypothetical protein Vadar_024533 [Vaccinium darrowii]|uniref:Uncharacterized protein n=1 Tax=Vaccinium darrowii TaxID=229202 RepID=A0ACB7X3N0_9ERIC|nr:hypothetical protein Vadar_024533 [Vaccinium darrowii]